MKKLILLLIISTLFCCKKEDDNIQEPESIDIEISTEYPIAVYSDISTLEEELDDYISISNSNIPIEAIQKTYELNEENSEIKITISIKEEYPQYVDFDLSNNFIIIPIILQSTLIYDAIELLSQQSVEFGATYQQKRDMEEVLCNNLNSFDFTNSPIITIPITFHNHISSNLNQNDFERVINNLNSNFINSKIQFSLNEIQSIGTSGLNLNFDDHENYPYDSQSINIYVAPFISSNIIEGLTMHGIASFPTAGYAKIFIMSRFIKEFPDYQSTTLAHELGHLFSLYHTHENQGYPNNYCGLSGDGINETITHLDDWSNFNSCNDAQGQNETIMNNFMSYSWVLFWLRDCNRYFVEEQDKRMRFAAEYWYSNLFTDDSQINQSLNFYQYQGEVFETTESFSNPTFSQNGLHMYSVTDGKIAHYALSSKYNLENLNTPQELETVANGNTRLAKDVIISSDGATLFAKVKYVNFGSDLLLQYNLPNPYSLESAELVSQTEVFYAYNYFNISTDDETLYLMRNPAPNQGIKIIGYRFGTPNDISTISADNEYSSPWIGYPNSFLPYVISKNGNSVLRSPVVGNSRILERYEVSEPWKLSTISSNVESELSHNFSDNGIVEFYDEEEQIIFISTNEQGVYKLHKYER